MSVTDPLTVRYHFDRAVHLARSGRRGPVWLDVPLNVQAARVDEAEMRPYDPAEDAAAQGFDREVVRAQVAELVTRLRTAERPVVLAGSGIRSAGAVECFRRVVERLGVPVTTAWNALDVMYEDHPLFVGRPGTVGDRAGNFAVQSSDLLLSIGCRLNIRQIGYEFRAFARDAFKCVVDVDAVELRKPTISPDMPVHADAGFFLEELERALDDVPMPDRTEWLEWSLERKRRYPVVLPRFRDKSSPVNPYVFADVLSEHLLEDDVVVCANGAACVVALQALRLKRGMRILVNSGTASMGYDLPAAIGAAVASGRRVVCLAGDGSIQMNLQELETIAFRGLPVKVFVFDNGGYLSIRQTQENIFGGHFVGESARSGVGFPDMVRLATAYGIDAGRVDDHCSLDAAIDKALDSPGPALCDVVMDAAQNFEPKVMAEKQPDGTLVSKPLEDMYPFLPPDEAARNRLVPAWKPGRS